ncbi:MAG: hypothetical protein M3R30_03245 [Candidatus Eremiobacteraeota bacterium]|nr:hypothetical protein [Candidatus Eremiobacteraeota bacterium]
MLRWIRAWSALVSLVTLCVAPLCAHPLGNFTINHLARITAAPAALHVRYVLDIAEIPTFQIGQTRGVGSAWTAAQLQSWANDEIPTVVSAFHLSVDGKTQALQPGRAVARVRPGAGGLPILYWVGTFSVPITAGAPHAIAIDDAVYADRRIGWKDIVVGTQTEPTHELQIYPSALIGTPRRINAAAFSANAGGAIANVTRTEDSTEQIASAPSFIPQTMLSDMFSSPHQTPLFILLTILAAFGLGALHAVEPGHGKALLAFTLVGARATGKQALILALSLTFAHTAGVLLLGVVLYFAAGFVSESIYPWINLVSGVAIAIIGARTLQRYIATRRAVSHQHAHEHDGAQAHSHDHDHGHLGDGEHGHSHAIPGAQPLTFRNAIWAAMSGGIAPCPAAIVVLLAALRLHQVGYGVFIIVIFSLGLAAVLSGLGIAVVHGSAMLSKHSVYARLVPYGPLVSASVISVIGAWLLGQGFTQTGVQAPSILLAAIALAAIGGYAFAQHGHTHVHHAHAEAVV